MAITFPSGVSAQAAEVWSASIQAYGRDVTLRPNDLSPEVVCKAFCKRPKILGLFDRTEQSYDQTRYMVMIRAQDVPGGVDKFDRVRWDDVDHAVISVTDVDLGAGTFGYRLLVKG
jgi:hypothetical protein